MNVWRTPAILETWVKGTISFPPFGACLNTGMSMECKPEVSWYGTDGRVGKSIVTFSHAIFALLAICFSRSRRTCSSEAALDTGPSREKRMRSYAHFRSFLCSRSCIIFLESLHSFKAVHIL